MADFVERLIAPISNMEFERRWSAVRAAMAERGIDVLVIQNSNEFSRGYVKWLTDIPAGNGTMTTVIMPKDDLMTVVAPGPFGVRRSPCLVARRVLIIRQAERPLSGETRKAFAQCETYLS
jgi:hypothetical protein